MPCGFSIAGKECFDPRYAAKAFPLYKSVHPDLNETHWPRDKAVRMFGVIRSYRSRHSAELHGAKTQISLGRNAIRRILPARLWEQLRRIDAEAHLARAVSGSSSSNRIGASLRLMCHGVAGEHA